MGEKPGVWQENRMKSWMVAQKRAAQLQKILQVFLNFEHFPSAASAKARGVQNNSIITSAAPQFPVEEFVDIVNDPTDRSVLKLA